MNAKRYFLLGTGLFAVKFGIDYGVACAFGRSWAVYNYVLPTEISAMRLMNVPWSADTVFFLTLLAVAIPFVAVGTWATMLRLRDAGLSRGLVLLFFVPVINLMLFAILSLSPSRRPERLPPDAFLDEGMSAPSDLPYARPALRRVDTGVARWMPETDGASTFASALIVAPLAPLITFFGVAVLKDYSSGLFIGMPFVLGFLAAVVNGLRCPRPMASSLGAASTAIVFGMAATFLFAIEGFICLIFLLPLAVPIALSGGLVGHVVQAQMLLRPLWWRSAALVLLLPLIMGGEKALRDRPTVFAVTTSVEIDAPPARVWAHVIAFGEIAPPTDWFFRTGAAYPIRARIEGSGVGAVRYCEFSTGPFVEPIVVWDEPRLLKFAVTHNPPPLREWSPYDIHPPHLENFLASHNGQFELVELPGGRTRLVGTTWYEHGMWPEAYWRLWTNWVIHKIHRRVLEHIRAEVGEEA